MDLATSPTRLDHPPADLAGIATGWLEVDGVAVHAARVPGADALGTADVGVVLLHHFYGNVATWRRVLRLLDAHGVPAVAVDRPGFGWSERPDLARADDLVTNPYTRAFAVQAARAAAAAAGFERVVVVGSSMGGTIAIELAAVLEDDRDGLDIAHLVLVSPALTGDVGMPPPLRGLLRGPGVTRAVAPLVRRLSRRVDLDRVAGGWHDDHLADQSDIDAYAVPIGLEGWARGIWQVMTVEPPPNLRRTAAGLAVPTTVVSPRFDRTIRPRWNRRTADAMDAALVELDAGHTPQEEAPHAVVEVILDALGRAGNPEHPPSPPGTA